MEGSLEKKPGRESVIVLQPQLLDGMHLIDTTDSRAHTFE